MNPDEQECAKAYWRFEYARISFQQARTAAEEILRKRPPPGDPLLMALNTAVYTLYAKPFGPNFGAGKLDPKIVPNESQVLHTTIIDFRNQLHTHRDATEPAVDGFGPLNRVEAILESSGKLTFRAAVVFDRQPQLEAIVELCNELEKKCQVYCERHQLRLARFLPPKPGVYRLNLADLDGPVWIRSESQ